MLTSLCFSVFRYALLYILIAWGLQTGGPSLAAQTMPSAAATIGKPTKIDQPPETPKLHQKPFRLDVDVVQVPVVVVNDANQPVLNLDRKNFKLFEDDIEQRLDSVVKEDAPISIGLILDFSSSMADKMGAELEAVNKFFEYANPKDDYFVVRFSEQPEVVADATRSIGTIQSQLASAAPEGFTALLDSIYFGVSSLQSAHYKRRALLIISDGGDNSSRYTLRETKAMLEEADVAVYAIALSNPYPIFRTLEEKFGQRLLKTVTSATGGRTILVDNAAQIPKAAAAISWELRSQYLLEYHSTNRNHDGKRRQVRVDAKSPGGAPLHGYYKREYVVSGR